MENSFSPVFKKFISQKETAKFSAEIFEFQNKLFFLFEIKKENKEKFREAISSILDLASQEKDINFEEILSKINKILFLLFKRTIKDKQGSLISDFEGVILFLKEKTLYFSHTQKSKIFLLRKGRFFQIDQSSSKEGSKDFFSFIISGEIFLKDKIFFYTPSLENYLSLERIKKKISEEKDFFSFFKAALRVLKPKEGIGMALLEIQPTSSLLIRRIKSFLKRNKFVFFQKRKYLDSLNQLFDFNRLFSCLKKAPGRFLIKISYIRKLITLTRDNKKRAFLFGFLILFLIFLINLRFLKIKEEKEKKISHLNFLLEEIKKSEIKADSFLIYDNEEEAKKTIKQAFQFIEEIEREKDFLSQKEEAESLRKKLILLFERANHFQKIEEPRVLFDFPFEPIGLLKIDSNFYFYNQRELCQKKQEIAENKCWQLSDEIIKGILFENEIIFLDKKNNLLKFKPKEERFEKISLSFPFKELEIVDLAVSDRRLYFLDKKNNQIIKHYKTLTGFSKGEIWLKEKKDLGKVVSVAIDGAIYLLEENGRLMKFYAGFQKDLDLAQIDPVLSSADKISTKTDSSFLYFLDSKSKRILIFDKQTQKLKKQIFSERFTKLEDFFVEEKEKKVYLLNSKEVFEINF